MAVREVVEEDTTQAIAIETAAEITVTENLVIDEAIEIEIVETETETVVIETEITVLSQVDANTKAEATIEKKNENYENTTLHKNATIENDHLPQIFFFVVEREGKFFFM